MTIYAHILVPTDFSAHSEHAAKRAAALAQSLGAQLSLVHVVDYIPPSYEAVELPPEFSSPEMLKERAGAHFEKWAREAGVGDAKRHVVSGSAKAEITRVAKKIGADLIVVGTSGESAIKMLIGSTTHALLHHAPCDVLSVQPAG